MSTKILLFTPKINTNPNTDAQHVQNQPDDNYIIVD